MSIWEKCRGGEFIGELSGTLYRLVESQEQIASLEFVDTLEEQSVLEELLEESKPPVDAGWTHLHYLLKTPFRYPPLKWGSRFGRVFEPSLFYAAQSVNTTLAESAYYRLIFLNSMNGNTPPRPLRTAHSLFTASFASSCGVKLQKPPFSAYVTLLRDKQNYDFTQTLGSEMRHAGVEAFEYVSARCPDAGCCTALFTPGVFTCGKPVSMQQWLCETTQHGVMFKALSSGEILHFSIDLFLLDGRLPMPAGES